MGLRLPQLKELRVLEKERPLLGKEQRKPGQADSLFVGFDLREVGIDREIQREIGAHTPLEIQADVSRRFTADGSVWSSVIEAATYGRNRTSRRAGRLSPCSLPATETRQGVAARHG